MPKLGVSVFAASKANNNAKSKHILLSSNNNNNSNNNPFFDNRYNQDGDNEDGNGDGPDSPFTVDKTPGKFPGDGDKKMEPPNYKSTDDALEVFSDSYFYKSQQFADYARKERQEVLQDMTVEDVFRIMIKGQEKGDERGYSDFAYMISAGTPRVRSYFEPATLTVEQVLADKKLIDLTGTLEVKLCEDLFVAKLPTVDQVWTAGTKANGEGKPGRALPLGLVLGPSGSGKTFFALKYLTDTFLKPSTTKEQVSVYVQPASYAEKINFKDDSPLVAKQLINEVMASCASDIDRKIDHKLDMHLCLIFDEAGSSHTKAWFETRKNLESLCKEAQTLATSVAVVVVGTGITGRQLSSTDDAHFFRMRTWGQGDLSKILERNQGYLDLAPADTVDTVANAIFAHPILSALATNARSAFFLVESVQELSNGCTRSSWERQLDEWTPALVTRVVSGYIGRNGLNNLDANQRRRVAAFVFRALQQMKKDDTTLPTFEGLRHSEKPVAESLLQYNLEGNSDKREILPSEDFAFTVTPAIAIILYSLAGVYATLVPGWKNEEEIAALYAARQLILGCMERYASDLSNGLSEKSCRNQLDESLGKIRLLRLKKPLQSASDSVSVPMGDDSTIIINGDIAKFADVISPYTLIQARRTEGKTSKVKLHDELYKCGMLKENCDTRLLRGLLATWQGTIDMENNGMPVSESVESKTNRNPQLSKAFPENLLSLVKPPDRIMFAKIHGRSDTMTIGNDTKIPLPALDGTTITFIASTNAEEMNLVLTPSTRPTNRKRSATEAETLNAGESTPVAMTITEADLNDDMEIDVGKLSDPVAKIAWTSFMGDEIPVGVKLKFLFTI